MYSPNSERPPFATCLLSFLCKRALMSLFCRRALWKRLYSAKETYSERPPFATSTCTPVLLPVIEMFQSFLQQKLAGIHQLPRSCRMFHAYTHTLSKETYTYMKRDLHIYEKKPTYIWKEMYTTLMYRTNCFLESIRCHGQVTFIICIHPWLL